MRQAHFSAPSGTPSPVPSSSTLDAHPGSHAGVAKPVAPPSKHQLAAMIWVAVFPTLTVLNLTLGPWLADLGPVVRTFVLATVAVPIVIYGIMPRLHRIRARLLARRAA
jgi:antibiotic biosynthesis monooxygenase (ABM) superfamily enzyme